MDEALLRRCNGLSLPSFPLRVSEAEQELSEAEQEQRRSDRDAFAGNRTKNPKPMFGKGDKMANRIDFGRWDVKDWTPSDSNREIPADLRRLFVGDAQWPVSAASFAALIDLGMSDHMIATYFGIDTHRVSALRYSYGLGRASR